MYDEILCSTSISDLHIYVTITYHKDCNCHLDH